MPCLVILHVSVTKCESCTGHAVMRKFPYNGVCGILSLWVAVRRSTCEWPQHERALKTFCLHSADQLSYAAAKICTSGLDCWQTKFSRYTSASVNFLNWSDAHTTTHAMSNYKCLDKTIKRPRLWKSLYRSSIFTVDRKSANIGPGFDVIISWEFILPPLTTLWKAFQK